jgi:D-sedoheptulose 7-phosphate isomerase
MAFSDEFLAESAAILGKFDISAIEAMIGKFVDTRRRGGRIFCLGVGGSAATASHCVNDLRKIGRFEAYAPTDNVAELSARTNDEGWETVFSAWLVGSRLTSRDMVFVLSVGGGDIERNISPNLVRALQYAREIGATICGVVGRDGGYTAKVADAAVIVPTMNPAHITPQAEALAGVICHLLVTHPAIKAAATKWEASDVKPTKAEAA